MEVQVLEHGSLNSIAYLYNKGNNYFSKAKTYFIFQVLQKSYLKIMVQTWMTLMRIPLEEDF